MPLVSREIIEKAEYVEYWLPTQDTPPNIANSLNTFNDKGPAFIPPASLKAKALDQSLRAGAYLAVISTPVVVTLALAINTHASLFATLTVADLLTACGFLGSRLALRLRLDHKYHKHALQLRPLNLEERLRAVVKHNLELAHADMSVLRTYDLCLANFIQVNTLLQRLPEDYDLLTDEQRDCLDVLVPQALRLKGKLMRLHALSEEVAYTVLNNSTEFAPSPVSSYMPAKEDIEEVILQKEALNGLYTRAKLLRG